MKITYNRFGMTGKAVSIEEFVSSEIQTQREGSVEEAAANANAAIEALARLTDVLASKGMLTAKEVGLVASGFNYDIAFLSFEETPK